MPFEKGHKLATGRPPGAVNKRTEQWEIFAEWFMTEGMERLQKEMAELKPKDYITTCKDLMEYFQPKLARSEIKATVETKPTVIFLDADTDHASLQEQLQIESPDDNK